MFIHYFNNCYVIQASVISGRFQILLLGALKEKDTSNFREQHQMNGCRSTPKSLKGSSGVAMKIDNRNCSAVKFDRISVVKVFSKTLHQERLQRNAEEI